jgi:predicted peptidase
MSCQRLALAFVVAATLAPAARAAEYEARVFKGPAGKTLPYRLLTPADYDKARHYPLVLLLHGFGDRGTDNEKHLKSKSNGTALFADEKNRSKFPCFVVAPQTPSVWISEPDFNVNTPFKKEPAEGLMLTALLLEAMLKEFSVDKDRIYLMGYSNGGCGTWDMLVRAPTKIAAAVIKSGAGDPAAIAVAKKGDNILDSSG